jgi:hypothetical protein
MPNKWGHCTKSQNLYKTCWQHHMVYNYQKIYPINYNVHGCIYMHQLNTHASKPAREARPNFSEGNYCRGGPHSLLLKKPKSIELFTK